MQFKCLLCGNESQKSGINQKYCGSQKEKDSCSRKAKRLHYKTFYSKHKSKIIKNNVAYNKFKYSTDIIFKLKKVFRERIKTVLRRGKDTSSSLVYLGISFEEYKKYLENLFELGMSWDNYGEWEIDHIKPISLFKPEEFKEAFHFSNTQPMWSKLNKQKYNKYGV